MVKFTFRRSPSAYFDAALDEARGAAEYHEIDYGSGTVYEADFSYAQKGAALCLYELTHGWRTVQVRLDGRILPRRKRAVLMCYLQSPDDPMQRKRYCANMPAPDPDAAFGLPCHRILNYYTVGRANQEHWLHEFGHFFTPYMFEVDLRRLAMTFRSRMCDGLYDMCPYRTPQKIEDLLDSIPYLIEVDPDNTGPLYSRPNLYSGRPVLSWI